MVGTTTIGPNNFFYIILIYCCDFCHKSRQYVWSNGKKKFKNIPLKSYCCGFRRKSQQYGYFIFFFLRDIMLRMGKTTTINNYSTSDNNNLYLDSIIPYVKRGRTP